MAKFCNTCYCWEKVGPQAVNVLGACHSEEVKLKVHLDFPNIDRDEEGQLWTDQFFGCVHWKQNDGSLVSINKTLRNE